AGEAHERDRGAPPLPPQERELLAVPEGERPGATLHAGERRIDDEGEPERSEPDAREEPDQDPKRTSPCHPPRLLLDLGEELLRRSEILVAVEGALQHLESLLVVLLAVADVRQVVEDLALADRRAVVELLQEQRAERLLGAVDVRLLGLVVAHARELE